MTDSHDEFDLSMVFDLPNAFVMLLYQCKAKVAKVNEDHTLVDTNAVLIRATRLTEKGEKAWHYGDNRPKWLLSFMDEHADAVESRIRSGLEKRMNASPMASTGHTIT